MKKHLNRLAPILILTAAVPFSASSQTQIDLGKQTSDVDFSHAAFTRPIKVGISLPSNCTTGDLFFNSASAIGTNLFGCAPANSWSQLGNNSGGSGNSGVSFAYDNGTANLYAVSLPSVSSYTDGLQILILPANSNTTASTLAVSGLPPVAIKTPQGLDTLTPGSIRFGSPADLVYSASDGYFILTNPAVVTQQAIAAGTGFLADFTEYPPLVSPDPTYICLQTQTCSPTGGQNLSGAAFLTLPNASSDPPVCSVGQFYFNTISATNRSCTSTNTWSGSGGAGSGTFCNLTGVASGAAACPGAPAPASLTGLIMSVQADAANTGPVTVNVAGLGVTPLLTATGSALAANALTAGVTYLAAYTGSAFHLASSGGPMALQTHWDFCTAAPCSTSVDIITQPYPITVPTWNPVYGLISAGTAPTGSSLIITVYKNGSVAQAFTLPAGSTSAVLAPTFSCVQGDVLTASVTQVGSTIAGEHVTIVLTASVAGTTGAAGANGAPGASGPVSFVANARTSTYQTLSSDFASCKSIPVASGTFTITLVAGGSQPPSGQCVFIINYGSGVVTVAPSGQNVNGSSSSLALAAGSPSAPIGILVVSDGTDYEAQLFGTAGTGTLTARTYNLLIGGINAAGAGLYPTATLSTGGMLSNAGAMNGSAGLPYISYASAGSQSAYWAWAIDQNWDSTKPVNITIGAVDPNENGGNFKWNVTIGCFTSGGSTAPAYGSTGATGSFAIIPVTAYIETSISSLSMSACAASQLAIVNITRDSTVSGNSGDAIGLVRATLTYSVQ
jgi:hypothetical protein